MIYMQALIALYEAGFPAIGQIHSGNVFKVNGSYVLGGYENTLLGYRTSLYHDIAGNEDWMNRIDVILFGKSIIIIIIILYIYIHYYIQNYNEVF